MPAKLIRPLKYVSPDGQQFDTLALEQEHELKCLMDSMNPQGSSPAWSDEGVAAFILDSKDKILPILSQRERKHASPATPKARKPRKAKTEPAPVV